MSPSAAAAERTALVTGANRGIGLATASELARRGLNVVVTARRRADAEQASIEVRAAAAPNVRILPVGLDVSHAGAAAACRDEVEASGLRVDALVNNAGVYPSGDFFQAPDAAFEEAIAVHVFGVLWMCRAFVPGMLSRGYGRVVNVSSGSGSVGEGLEGPAAYSISKAALGAVTIKLAQTLRGDVKANAVCPGWVRTRMGGPGARRSLEKGAEALVWLATLPADGPNGVFFRDRKPIPW